MPFPSTIEELIQKSILHDREISLHQIMDDGEMSKVVVNQGIIENWRWLKDYAVFDKIYQNGSIHFSLLNFKWYSMTSDPTYSRLFNKFVGSGEITSRSMTGRLTLSELKKSI